MNAAVLLIIVGLVAVFLWWGRRAFTVNLFRSASANDFVYVEDDGAVRDLTTDERAYLDTRFAGDDGGRPYVKASYWSVGPDGRRNGFIYRSLVPGHVRIRKNDA